MKSDLVKKLLRALVTALGIGLGSVLAFVIVQLNAMAGNPAMSVGALLALYAAFALLLGLGGYLIAPRTIDSITRLIALVERCMDKMTFEQQAGSISGLVGGFIIAALLSQLVMLMGASMFTVAMCAILFVVFGVLGVTLGDSPRGRFQADVPALQPQREQTGRFVAQENQDGKTETAGRNRAD